MKGGPRRKTTSSDQPQPHRLRNDVVSSESEQNREQQMNDASDRYEDEEEEDDDDEYDEDYEDQFNENEEDEEEGEEEEEERPKLAEGYYEIETVRKKRSRKGQVQYLIKWRGWPETSNTWEPVENLMSCSDIIDAFEERMKSTKQKSSKKHKRKSGVALQPPPAKKKKQQPQQQQQQQPPGSPAANYEVPSVRIRLIDEPLSRSSGNDPSCSKWAESSVKGVRNVRKAKHVNENGSLLVSRQIDDINEANELNVTLSELKGTASTDKENTNKPDVHNQEDQSGGVGPSNGISNVNGQKSVWVSRSGGAKRRKSSSVKRFTQDTNPVVTNDAHDAIERIASANGGGVEHGIQKFDQVGNCVGSVNVVDTTRSMYAITKIIKPIEYSISTLNDMHDILVTFLVLRSDGKEVMVDNRYLKANYPYLLINFYEQHIQYANPTE